MAETRVFFAVWLAMGMLAALRPRRVIWLDQLRIAMFAFGALPFVNAATSDRHLLASIRDGDALRAGFDLSMLAFALMFAFAAHGVGKVARRDRNVISADARTLRQDAA